MATPKVSNKYPRQGEKLAPATLREFLLEPIPERFWAQSGDEAIQLCDLDETAWERFPPEALREFARVIVDRVAGQQVRKAFQDRRFPRPAPGTRLAELALENRTRRCLTREGFAEDLTLLGAYTIGRIMTIRAFGPRCLVDLLTALESRKATDIAPGADDRRLSAELTASARRLAELPEAKAAHQRDPRFAELIREVDAEAETAADLARRLLARTADPLDPSYAAEQVRQLHKRIRAMSDLTLEEELIEIFASTRHERNRQILIGYYGWGDGQQHTLTEIGVRFGITRERVRQVCAKATRKPKGVRRLATPVTDRILKLIARRIPCSADALEAELVERGLTRVAMSIESVAAGAKLLDRSVAFKVVKLEGKRLIVHPAQMDAAVTIVDLAKKDLYFHGLATIAKIQQLAAERHPAATAELVEQVLQLIDGFAWLDRRTGWFWIRSIAKHGLPKAVDKILSVAGAVSVSQMREAMSRNRRLWKDPPPAKVLLEFCRQSDGIRVEGRRIVAESPRDWQDSLTGVELELAKVLREHGPVMERSEMEDLCIAAGMNRFSFHAFVSWSPIIQQFGHSVYGLLGTKAPKRAIDRLLDRRRVERKPHRVLDDHGRTPDGKVWLTYRLSKAASTYAVITVPAALKKVVHGRFDLIDPDGRTIGTLATKDGRAWGLGAYLRQQGAAVGDLIRLTLDLKRRTAMVSLGAETA